MKLKTQLHVVKHSLRVQKILNLGPPDILETTRKLNLKILLDMVKYPHWVQKLLYYTTQHEDGRHIDF